MFNALFPSPLIKSVWQMILICSGCEFFKEIFLFWKMIQVSNLVIYSELPGFIITVCGPSSVILSVSALIKNRPLWWSLSSLTVKQGEKLKKSWRWSLQNAQHIHKYTQKMENKTMEATWSTLCKDLKNEMNFV